MLIFYQSKNVQIQMKWMGADQNNVNSNISLAQFTFNMQLMDSYSTDYYEIAYPGLIMRVCLYIRCFILPRLHLTMRQIDFVRAPPKIFFFANPQNHR